MRKFARSSLPLMLVFLVSTFAAAQKTEAPNAEAAKPENKKTEAPASMMTYQMVLFKQAPKTVDAVMKTDAAAAEKAFAEKAMGHKAILVRLNRERITLIYGPFTAPGAASMKELIGLAILDVADAETAKKHFAVDPFVISGEWVLEVKPWLGPRGWFSPPVVYGDVPSHQTEPFIFGVLVRGPAAKANPPVHTMEQRQEFQKGHLAYMSKLHEQGKLVMAGPFMEDGDWRGVVVYRVASVDEAQALAANDPAVKAGRLTLEARPWKTVKGILK